ncbi:hypothetical protein I4F81_000552 [Pyropia yezoensis]|uniref:Uncharacterized protein n=2 Tax=Pyropia yezoensis TaxID=2788 RepID=A0ACC3BHQ7_PYRYE|nr:hypothetical protein I4F81_000006 [Neopyropia yezoensis]KAK1857938.1 hypothetical protein I4F81_000552 [Neopyropia yezoensis]
MSQTSDVPVPAPPLPPLDASQERAMELFRSGANIALFGRAGCGKSEVMRRMVAEATARWGREGVAVSAFSGSAALAVVPVKVTDTSADRMVFESITERSTLQGSQGQVVCLTGSYRQADDLVFRGLLDKMRWGCARPQDLTAVNATWSTPLTGHVTKLRIRKVAVTEINRHNLLSITSEPYEFTARDVFLTADVRERKDAEASLRTCVDFSLTLKQSALVILTRNVEGIPPGTGGIVKDIISRELVVDGRTLRAESVFCDHLIQASRCSLAYYAVVLRLRGSSPEEDGQPPRDE